MNPQSKDPLVRYMADLEKRDEKTLERLDQAKKALEDINDMLRKFKA